MQQDFTSTPPSRLSTPHTCQWRKCAVALFLLRMLDYRIGGIVVFFDECDLLMARNTHASATHDKEVRPGCGFSSHYGRVTSGRFLTNFFVFCSEVG